MPRRAPETLSRKFQSYLEPRMSDEIRISTNGNQVFGNERFKQDMADMLIRRVTPGQAGRPEAESKINGGLSPNICAKYVRVTKCVHRQDSY